MPVCESDVRFEFLLLKLLLWSFHARKRMLARSVVRYKQRIREEF
jgi:hypothetical protein